MRRLCTTLLWCFLISSLTTSAQLSVSVNSNGNQLSQIMSGPGVIISNVILNCPTGAAGSFTCNNCSLGMDSGIILCTGNIDSIPGPNNNSGQSDYTSWGTAGDQDLANSIGQPVTNLHDACVLEFDLTTQSDSVEFNYIFGSEEYPEFICSSFNDAFAFFISGPGITGMQNIALVPGTAIPVSINSVNSGTPGAFANGTCNGANQSLAYSQYYVNNGDGSTAPYNSNPYYVQYDGFTTILRAAIGNLIACQTYHLKLAIADVTDGKYDSGVFIEANSLSSNEVTFDTAKTSVPGIDSAIRGCVDGIFTLNYLRPVSQTTAVHFTIGGTAVNGADYTQIADSAVFQAGDSTQQIIIQPLAGATQPQSVILYLYNSCSALPYDSVKLFITSPPSLTAGPDTTICNGDTVQLYINTNNGGSYAWSPANSLSAANVSNPLAFPSSTTTYNCTATYAGCSSTGSVTVTVLTSAPFTVSAGPDILVCGGNTAQLNATVIGAPIAGHPFQYAWSPANELNNANTQNPVDVTPGLNTFIVSATSGHCTATDTVNVNIDNVTETMSSTPASCFYSSNGTATATTTAGTAPFTYSWSSSSAGATASNLAQGLYHVTITDQPGCTATDTVTVYAPAPINFSAPSVTPVSCPGGNNGAATIAATGGTGSFTYNWSSGATTATASSLSAGNYTVTATDANTCTATTVVTVNTLPPLAVNINTTNVSCFGGSDGKAAATVTGGTSPYNYLWSTTSTASSITGLSAGPVSLTVTDNAGCTVTSGATVAQQPLLVASQISSNVSCYNQNNGIITVSVNGGTTPYTFLWSDNIQQENRTNLAPGTYVLTVVDANNCTDTTAATITQPSQLIVTASVTNVTCFGASNGAINLTVSGGSPPYSYNWGNGLIGQNAMNIPADYYYPSVTDNQGCMFDTMLQVTSPGPIVFADSIVTNVSCYGGNNGVAQVLPSGGTGSFTYTWNNVAANNPDSNFTAGTYNVIATDANNCTASQVVVIGQPTLLSVTISGRDALCYQGADGSAFAVVTGGIPPYRYLWSNGETKDTATLLVAGAYQSTVTDNNGCTTSSSIVINQPGQIIFTVDSTPVKCIGTSTGTLSLDVTSGGVPPYTYSATQDGSNFITTTDSVIIGLATGWYIVQVADNNGCVLLDSAFVPNAVPDSFSISTDSTSCYGTQYADGAVNIAGLVPQNTPYQYAIDGGAFQYSGDFFDLAAGSHNITISNYNGCITDTSATIGAPIQAVAEITPADTTIQLGESIQLFSSFGNYPSSAIVSYNWVPSAGLSCSDCASPVVSSYAHINNYNLTITYNQGCIVTASARVIVVGSPPIYIPNSFTPNGDGNNDLFLIYGELIKTVHLKIFNRWGEKVFDSENQFLGWDGNYKGQQQNPGVYVYEAQITFLDNTQTLRTGSITLIR